MQIVFCMITYMTITAHLFLILYQITGTKEIKQMTKKFSEKQNKIYKDICRERMIHYSYGIIVGISLAYLYMLCVPNITNRFCTFVGISTIITQNFYLLMPKSKWMIKYLDNPQDRFNWNKLYKKFQYLSVYGNFIGFILFASTQYETI